MLVSSGDRGQDQRERLMARCCSVSIESLAACCDPDVLSIEFSCLRVMQKFLKTRKLSMFFPKSLNHKPAVLSQIEFICTNALERDELNLGHANRCIGVVHCIRLMETL